MSSSAAGGRSRLSATWRTAVFMGSGGLLVVPYIVLLVWLGQLAEAGVAAVVVGVVLVLLLLAVPALLPVGASLERTAARELLGAQVPEPATRDASSRGRAAAWFLLHLLAGAMTLVTIAVALPSAVVLVAGGPEGRGELTAGIPLLGGPAGEPLLGAAIVLCVALTVTLGLALRPAATVLLGPSAAQRVELDRARAREEARRNRLARELHDSVGHALSAAALQASAAEHDVRSRPEQAEQAMRTVAGSARRALAELDQVIGLLRDPAAAVEPPADLDDLADHLAELAGQGLAVESHVDRRLRPAATGAEVWVEAFRIIQEALTNVRKHGADRRARLDLRLSGGRLELRVRSPLRPGALAPGALPAGALAAAERTAGGGRGIAGMSERAALVGGTLEAGPDGESWLVRAVLPCEELR